MNNDIIEHAVAVVATSLFIASVFVWLALMGSA